MQTTTENHLGKPIMEIPIPISLTEKVIIKIPYPLSEEGWEQMFNILNAYKPSIVRSDIEETEWKRKYNELLKLKKTSEGLYDAD